MAFTSSTPVDISTIWVKPERQRKDLGDLSGLKESLSRNGQIQPVVIERDGSLLAGERRYTAAKQLSWPTIEARYADDLTTLEREAIELDENVHRKDLPWQDVARAIARFHERAKAEHGQWNLEKTASASGMSASFVSQCLAIVPLLADTRVGGAAAHVTAYQTAMKIGQRRAEEANNTILDLVAGVFGAPPPPPPLVFNTEDLPAPAEEDDTTPEEEAAFIAARAYTSAEGTAERIIINSSFQDWLPTHSGAPYNFIHCDFPYGIDFQDSAQGGAGTRPLYEDSPETYFALLTTLIEALPRIGAENLTIMFWYSRKFYDATRSAFVAAGGQVWHNDLIWTKSDGKGIAADHTRYPRHGYETAMLIRFGDPKLNKLKNDWYSSPTVREIDSHSSEKPQPMLEHFFELFVDEFTRMLDPTCGSGSSVRAAIRLGAKFTKGIEMDPDFAKTSRTRLADMIKKVRAERAMKS